MFLLSSYHKCFFIENMEQLGEREGALEWASSGSYYRLLFLSYLGMV